MNTYITLCINMNFKVRECVNHCEWSRGIFWGLEFDAVSCQVLRSSLVFWMGKQTPRRRILWRSNECNQGTENTMWYQLAREVNGKCSHTRCCYSVFINLLRFHCSQKARQEVFILAYEISYNRAIISWGSESQLLWRSQCNVLGTA